MGLGVESFNMVVTPQRLIMLPLTNQEMREAVRAARDQARAEGKGFFGQIGAQWGWLNVLYRRYQEPPPGSVAGPEAGQFRPLSPDHPFHPTPGDRRLPLSGR